MNRVPALAALILLASCAAQPSQQPAPSPDRLRMAIAPILSKETLGGPALADSVSEHLQDELFACRRFEIVERRHLDRVIEEKGDLSAAKAGAVAGADVVVHGVITEENGGAYVHLRVVRVSTGIIAFSGRRLIEITDATPSKLAVRSAVDELVREIIMRFP